MEQRPARKPNRLPNYDYSHIGSYFVTVCVQDMRCVLSNIVLDPNGCDAFVDLTSIGQSVENTLSEMAQQHPDIRIDRFVIMPNHVHLLISIVSEPPCGASGRTPPTNTLSRFVGTFKRFTQRSCGQRIWQRGFYDHVIRDEEDYWIRYRYIDENPKKWLIRTVGGVLPDAPPNQG